MAKNMMNRDAKSAFGPQNQIVTIACQGNVSLGVGNTQSYPRSVLGIIEDTHRSPSGMNKFVHSRASAPPVSSAVLLQQDVAPAR